MRYRKLTASGDYSFGHGQQDFLVNSPACVAQAVLTRLRLITGEWFLDVTDGTPYTTRVLGNDTGAVRDAVIRERIAATPGVRRLDSYSSSVNPSTRRLSVTAEITTVYGRSALAAEVALVPQR